MKAAAIVIPIPPAGVCPCCYTRQVLASVERAALTYLRLYFDANPPKLGDYCGQTAQAAVQAAERAL